MTPFTGTLNPGIARLVHWLRDSGFDTIDSGDGRTSEHDCDRPYPYVVMRGVEADARRLAAHLRGLGIPLPPSTEVWGEGETPIGVMIQYTYNPVEDLGLVELIGLDDAQLFP